MFFGCGDFRHEARGRRPGAWESGFGGFWGAGGPAGWAGFKRGRVFAQGDLKYVILQLLDEKPRHGYEIIKELEDRFGGAYSPSPGTVYPTLTMLEDLGYAKATPEDGGKKIFEITAEGRAYLAEHRTTVDDIFGRIADFGAGFFGAAMMEVHQAMKEVARATYSSGAQTARDPERLRKVKEILERAAKELDSLAPPQAQRRDEPAK
jgi:DNA-binding PadR family transcriptional regulator